MTAQVLPFVLHGAALGRPLPSRAARACAAPPRESRAYLGRQPIATVEGQVCAVELLHRPGPENRTDADRWSTARQDAATQEVLVAALRYGLDRLCGDLTPFVNATRTMLLGRLPVPPLPTRLGVEVLESVVVDDAVLDAVAALRAAGHRIAVDDFTGTPSQRRLLGLADVVKVDIRDLAVRGPGLLAEARSAGALVLVERVETAGALQRCRDLGVDLVQGYLIGRADVLDVTVPETA